MDDESIAKAARKQERMRQRRAATSSAREKCGSSSTEAPGPGSEQSYRPPREKTQTPKGTNAGWGPHHPEPHRTTGRRIPAVKAQDHVPNDDRGSKTSDRAQDSATRQRRYAPLMELCQVLTQCVTVIIGEVVQKLWWLVLQVLRKTLVFLILSGLVYLFLYTVARRPLSWATAVVFGSYTPGSAPRIATHVAQVQRDPPAPKHELTAAPAAPANPYVPGAQVGLEYLSAVVTRPQKDGPASEILLSVFEEEGSRPKNGDANAVATAWSSRWDDLQHAMADAALSDREAHGAVMERLAHAFHGATAILVEMRNRPASAMAAADASARRGFVARASRLARTVADQAVGAVTRARRPRRRSATLELVYRRAASFADLLGSAILDCELMMSFATSNSELHRRISFVEEGVCGMVGVFNRAVLVGDKAVDQATNAHRKQGRRRQQAVMQRGEAKAEASLTTRELSQAVFTLRGWQAFGSQVCEQARESSAMLEGWFLDAEAERRRLDTRRGVVQGQLAMLDMEVCSDDDAVRIEEELETQIGEFVGALRSMYTNES